MAKREAGSTSPVVRQIDKQFLVCSICLDHYRNPKVLPCLHTFCERVLMTRGTPVSGVGSVLQLQEAPLCCPNHEGKRRAPRACDCSLRDVVEQHKGCAEDTAGSRYAAEWRLKVSALHQNLGVLLTTAAVAHTSVATGEGLHA
ncbi:tripartite motif-containing protein 2-like protein [Lates japonicus]|uniref:Tripartite motif-containing protein 2-like protein n=1 Tax=Lates japonicus TaxID=270547 RepID=A0AAD3M8Z7_LATJO|nr:tripartite motif-containing protein 2-like protein [Lates japonicus]